VLFVTIPEEHIYRRVRRFIKHEDLFHNGAKILIAVSGGVDSMTLLSILYDFREEFGLRLAVAHVNHGIREIESPNEEAFVRASCERLKIPVYVHRVDPAVFRKKESGSVQEIARNIRYAFFDTRMREIGFDCIATAHTANDNAETVFLNLLRGAGLEGMRGIPPKRDAIVRPVLCLTRSEIESFALDRGIEFRTDSSNRSGTYARNIIRNEVFPLIESRLRANVAQTVNRSSSIFREVDEYMRFAVGNLFPQSVGQVGEKEFFISSVTLQSLPPVIADYLIRETVSRIADTTLDFDTTRRIGSLLASSPGAAVQFAPGFRAARESDGIRFHEDAAAASYCVPVEPGEEYRIGGNAFRSAIVAANDVRFDENKNVEYIDFEKIRQPLYLRNWREGDFMIPLGMRTRKKISDIFIDAKIPIAHKQRVPILASDDSVIWVCGVQLDDRAKVTENTKYAVRLEYHPAA
jgi:tRNA(Ile)-lysidine synthase